jgi:hypothetical protein
MQRLRRHLTYANVMVTVLAFVVLTGGAAYAANTIFSSDIVDGEVKGVDIGNNQVRSADVRDDSLSGGGLIGADLQADSVAAIEVQPNSIDEDEIVNDSLSGADIADQSGVDTCVSTTRIGQLCVRAENLARSWENARNHCANLDLRIPTMGEALELAKTHTIPNVTNEFFWTDEVYWTYSDAGGNEPRVYGVYGASSGQSGGGTMTSFTPIPTTTLETVCVTTPTN